MPFTNFTQRAWLPWKKYKSPVAKVGAGFVIVAAFAQFFKAESQ